MMTDKGYMASVRKRVARGARLLDKIRPSWWRKVRVKSLNMMSPSHCILGWAFDEFVKGELLQDGPGSGYMFGIRRIYPERWGGENGHEYGFAFDGSGDDEADVLAEEWIKVIRARRAA